MIRSLVAFLLAFVVLILLLGLLGTFGSAELLAAFVVAAVFAVVYGRRGRAA